MTPLLSKAIRCPFAEFLYSIFSMYPPAGSYIETVSDTVNLLYSTGVSCPMTLPFPRFTCDGPKFQRALPRNWLSISISSLAPVRVRSLLLVL